MVNSDRRRFLKYAFGGLVGGGLAAGLGDEKTGKAGSMNQEGPAVERMSTDGEHNTTSASITVKSRSGLSGGNPFADSSGEPKPRSQVIDDIVSWNMNGRIDGVSYGRGEIISFVVEWNQAT